MGKFTLVFTFTCYSSSKITFNLRCFRTFIHVISVKVTLGFMSFSFTHVWVVVTLGNIDLREKFNFSLFISRHVLLYRTISTPEPAALYFFDFIDVTKLPSSSQ